MIDPFYKPVKYFYEESLSQSVHSIVTLCEKLEKPQPSNHDQTIHVLKIVDDRQHVRQCREETEYQKMHSDSNVKVDLSMVSVTGSPGAIKHVRSDIMPMQLQGENSSPGRSIVSSEYVHLDSQALQALSSDQSVASDCDSCLSLK